MTNPYDRNVMQGAAVVSKQVTSYINAVGTIVGIIAINLSDVIFGGIMLGMLLKDIDVLFGSPIDGWLFGFIVSFAFWFIQLLMWQMVFEDNIISLKDAVPLTLAIAVAIVDTNIDVAPIFLWVHDSTIATVLRDIPVLGSYSLYDITEASVIIGFYIVNGCSELFNAWYITKNDILPSGSIMKQLGKLNKRSDVVRAHQRQRQQQSQQNKYKTYPRGANNARQ